MRTCTTIVGLACVLATGAPSQAAEAFDGLWARTQKDCRNQEGTDSKTFIDLSKAIGAKPAPMVDQYENHCRIDRKTTVGDGLVLATTCFEFWDDFKKAVNGRKVTTRLAPGPGGTIKIDGRPYQRCDTKIDGAKRRK